MNALHCLFAQSFSQAPKAQQHRTDPLRGTITQIDGYSRKLRLHLMEASPYWRVRYWEDRRIFRSTTRTTYKQQAIKRAKEIFADITVNRINARVINRMRGCFDTVAQEQLEYQKLRVLNGEVTPAKLEKNSNRLRRDILPFFKGGEIRAVDFNAIDAYIH